VKRPSGGACKKFWDLPPVGLAGGPRPHASRPLIEREVPILRKFANRHPFFEFNYFYPFFLKNSTIHHTCDKGMMHHLKSAASSLRPFTAQPTHLLPPPPRCRGCRRHRFSSASPLELWGSGSGSGSGLELWGSGLPGWGCSGVADYRGRLPAAR
jgi:hypothetical protein